jgi:hypothetical protein
VDAVQEYKVQTNNLGAEFANTGGGVVNVITKSGTNQFHGSGWEFFRTTGLTANDFFSNQADLPRAAFRYNQFGATLGGPIVKAKTFFFFAYEGIRWTQAGSAVGTLPTAAQRTGDFSSFYDSNGQVIPIYDPFSTRPDPNNPGEYIRTQYPGNKIPADKIDPVAATLLTYVPLPNQAGVPITGKNNYYLNFSSPTNENSFSLRIDHALSASQKLYGRYSINDTDQPAPFLYGKSSPNFLVSNPAAGDDVYREQQATIDYTNVITPKLVLDLNSSYVRYALTRLPGGFGVSPTVVGLPSYFDQLVSSYLPLFLVLNVSGYGVNGSLVGANGTLHKDAYPDLHEYGNLTYLHGSHTLKAGASFGVIWNSTPKNAVIRPNLAFDSGFTRGPDPLASNGSGDGLASFLAGAGQGSTPSGGPTQYLSSKYWGVYVQDDWRVTPKLTLNLGIRYDRNMPWIERFNRFTNWDPAATSPLQAPSLPSLTGGLVYPGTNGLPRGEFNTFNKEVGPRLGLAYSLNPKTVLRGGYGIFFAPLSGAGFNAPQAISGFSASTEWVGTLDGVTPLNTLSNPFPNGFVTPTGSTQGLSTQFGQSVTAMLRNRTVSYAQQWNVDIQESLGRSFLLDIAYAGGRGVHLYADFYPNQLPDKYLSMGNALNAQVPNPFYGVITTGSLSAPTVAQSQLLRPYPQFGDVTLSNGSFFGASSYNSLQVKLDRRFANGFGLTVAYTFSKLLDNIPSSESGFGAAPTNADLLQNFNDLRGERAYASFDIPQYFTFNGLYELPFGKNRKFFNNSRLADSFIGGWQLNGITSFTSGYPQEVFESVNTLYNYNGPGVQRANWNGKNPSRSGKVSSRLNNYFNVSDFSDPAPFTYGNSPRSLGNLRSPQFISTDLSGIKRIPIHDRVSAEFRAEAFNLFNHPVFGPPDTAMDDGATGIISSLVNNPRQIQLAVKVVF